MGVEEHCAGFGGNGDPGLTITEFQRLRKELVGSYDEPIAYAARDLRPKISPSEFLTALRKIRGI